MRPLRLLHKLYGGTQIIRISQDWPKWFREYFTGVNDGAYDDYRMRCGVRLYTRRNRTDFHMIDEIWAFRKYDYFGYRVAPGDVVVDIGANIGLFSVYAAKVCRAERVISFEPFPENFEMLRKNAEQNQLDSITCVNQAVAGNRGMRTLILDSTDAGSHSLVSGVATAPTGRSVKVDCCTLDEVFQRFALSRIDYLKMDCEGSEYEILENAVSRLGQIRRISMETHTTPDRKAEDLEKLLCGHGFTVRRIDGSRLYASSTQQT